MAEGNPRLNEILNLLDPPKDLVGGGAAGGYTPAARAAIKTYIFALFGVEFDSESFAKFTAAGDTKKLMKKYFQDGFTDAERRRLNTLPTAGHLEETLRIITKIQILRDLQPNGHDPRPTGLKIAQDSGSKEVVKDPVFIITPGTILDPAGKTKDGAIPLVADDYATLPYEFIEELQMQKAIRGPITMVTSAEGYTFNIPIKFPNDRSEINARLSERTFLPVDATEAYPNNDGKYFKGNVTKNNFIQSHYDEADECKKYLLVKELGDSLQIAWLKHVISLGGGYTSGNTAIITCDTVVWYRALINGVGVILSYDGDTNYYPSSAEGAEAAFMATVRQEAISHNLTVIETIQKVISTEREANGKWLNASQWGDFEYRRAIAYLTGLKKELTKQNNDFDTYFRGVPNLKAAKELASRVHFINPFIWSKSERVFVVNKKVTYLREDETIRFSGASFTKNILEKKPPNPDPLLVPERFAQVAMAGGGIQKGGARLTVEQKWTRAHNGTPIADLIALSDGEWGVRGGNENSIVVDDDIIARNTRSLAVPTAAVPAGNPDNFRAHEIYEKYWTQNTEFDRGAAVELKKTPCFLYLFIRDFCPEIFTLGAMVKSIGIERFDDVGIDLPTRFNLRYRMNDDNRMLVYKILNVAYNPDVDPDDAAVVAAEANLYVPREEDINGSFSATLNAIALAKIALTEFPYLQTQFTKDFLAYLFTHYTAALPDTSTIRINAETRIALAESIQHQRGGGKIDGFKENLIALAAIQNYEIYYSLAISATYKDKRVSVMDFKRALLKASQQEAMIRREGKAEAAKRKVFPIGRATGLNPQNLATEKGLYNSLTDQRLSGLVNTGRYQRFGGSRQRKTQKKKKQGRKTRKGRGKK